MFFLSSSEWGLRSHELLTSLNKMKVPTTADPYVSVRCSNLVTNNLVVWFFTLYYNRIFVMLLLCG